MLFNIFFDKKARCANQKPKAINKGIFFRQEFRHSSDIGIAAALRTSIFN